MVRFNANQLRNPTMKFAYMIVFMSLTLSAQAASEIDEKIIAALSAESRPANDVVRDENRLPLETLKFFGMKDDMRVLELFPGGGWYTRVLAPLLAENGKLYVGLGTNRVRDNIAGTPGFEQLQVLDLPVNLHRPDGEPFYVMDEFEFGVSNLDMVVTFRNLHNFDRDTRAATNRQVFASLKSSGLYGVVDHTRRHMEALNSENRRRVDPVQIIKELLETGFEFVDYADLHYRADDELEYEVGRRSVSGNTDRFTMLFRKP
jgi:predicted methyltransferase